MTVIKLSRNDINEMIRHTVLSVLNESIGEEMGSIMANKEDAIQEIIDYVEEQWEEKRGTEKPYQEGKYGFDNGEVSFTGIQRDYVILVPISLTKKLGISDAFDINVGINDYEVPKEFVQYFGWGERGTEGTSYGAPKYRKFIRSTNKVEASRVDLIVTSVNGELQTQGLHSTLYHELNHTASRLEIQKKHQNLPDDELNDLHFFTATKRAGVENPHFLNARAMSPEREPLYDFKVLLMNDEDKQVELLKKKAAFVFYSVWELTERNARAEAIYGDLKELGATRETFRTLYKETDICHQIKECEDNLALLEKAKVPSKLWSYVGKVMNMKPRGRNNGVDTKALIRYQEAVKQRFLTRSNELLDMMYRKAMKVAELYFQRLEKRQQDELDKPGGGLARLGQELGTD